jgi:hypothetical protein
MTLNEPRATAENSKLDLYGREVIDRLEVLCIPARDQADEIVGIVACISALPPFALDHARALYAKLHAQSLNLHIVICLWHFEGDQQKVRTRMKLVSGHGFFTTLPETLQHFAFRAETPSQADQP